MHYSTIVATVLVSVAAAAPSSIPQCDGLTSAGGNIHPIPADDLQALSKRGSHVTKCGARGDS